MARSRRKGMGAAATVAGLASIAANAAWVIPLRLAKIARGGPAGGREARLMVDEKVRAAARAGATLLGGGSPAAVVRDVSRTVRANRKRLSS